MRALRAHNLGRGSPRLLIGASVSEPHIDEFAANFRLETVFQTTNGSQSRHCGDHLEKTRTINSLLQQGHSDLDLETV